MGSVTLSVDMSKALLRKTLEEIQLEPTLVEIIGKLHVNAPVDKTDF